MEIVKIVLDYIRVLVWPITILIITIYFKKQIIYLIAKISKIILPGGTTFELHEEVDRAETLSEKEEKSFTQKNKETSSIPLTEANQRMIEYGLRPVPSGLDFNYYKVLADQDPILALAGLRIELEILVKNLIKGWPIQIKGMKPSAELVRILHEHNAITARQYKLLTQVFRICDQVIHGAFVSKEDAIRTIEISELLSKQYISWLSWGFNKQNRNSTQW